MNERKLFENWKSFASKNELNFEFEDKPHLHGIISKLELKKGNQTLMLSRIGKTGSEYRQEWTKIFFELNEIPAQKVRIKNTLFNWLSKTSALEKQIQKALKSINASELTLSESESIIKVNRILFEEDEIKAALDLKKKIKQLLTEPIRNAG
jgi:hypothetical protein